MAQSLRRAAAAAGTALALALAALAAAPTAGPAAAAAAPPAMSTARWEYFGFGGDTDKSLSFIGGELAPGGAQPASANGGGAVKVPIIQYYLTSGGTTYYPDETASDLPSVITWTLARGYLPSPISSWRAGPVTVTIQHFASHIDSGAATAVYSRVKLANPTTSPVSMTLNITASPATEIPLTGAPTGSDTSSMYYTLTIPAGGSVTRDFAALGNGTATAAQLAHSGGFGANYKAMAAYWNAKLAGIAEPAALPDRQMTDLYKAGQIEQWESQISTSSGLNQYGSAGNESGHYSYAQVFPHDEEDIITQLIREGDYPNAAAILSSPAYASYVAGSNIPNGYLDTIGKWIEPFDYYQRLAHDPGFFTDSIKAEIQADAHRIAALRITSTSDPHYGLMQASNTFDNGRDYLMVDDLAAMSGLQSYANLATAWAASDPSWASEATWARSTAQSINDALNAYLTTYTIPRLGGYYGGCLDPCSKAPATAYNGNWLGTTFAMSSMPWDGSLAGSTLAGTWRQYLDTSAYAAFSLRSATAPAIPAHSWGAWSSGAGGYGTIYNAGGGEQLLASSDPDLRTEPIADLQWLLANQTAPMQWGESFTAPGHAGSWTSPEADYETWGLAQNNRTLLESSISVESNGTRIIGRGIPDSWITPGAKISWTGVPVRNGATTGFTITPAGRTRVTLTLTGDVSSPTEFELPLFAGNIVHASNGTADSADGTVTLPAGQTSTTVTVRGTPVTVSRTTDMGSTYGGGLTFGATGDQKERAQAFTANAKTMTSVRAGIRKRAVSGTGQTSVVASLYATSGGLPSGQPLATATVPAADVSTIVSNVTIPLRYSSLVPGVTYAIVLGQATPGSSVYEWAVTGSGGSGLSKINSSGNWQFDSGLGVAALTVNMSAH